MQNNLRDFLVKRHYFKTKLKLTITNHFEVKAQINGVKGRFILDTGASSSCVDFETFEKFKLNVKDSEIKAVGAGASNMKTKISKDNILKIGKWETQRTMLVLFDLTHVNEGLLNHNSNTVDGIIGADILKKAKAIIDYEKKYLYLKN